MKMPKSVIDLMTPLMRSPLLVLGGEGVPGVLLALLDAERDTATLLVDIQHHDLDLVAELHDLGRVDVLVGPVHLGDVDQTFHALFDLGEAAVIGEVRDLGHDAAALGVAARDLDPGIVAQLLEPQGNAVALAIELEHLDHRVPGRPRRFRRVLDALPGHVRDVQQAVDAAEVDEGTVVGEVLDHALDRLAFLQARQQRFALVAVSSSMTARRDTTTLLRFWSSLMTLNSSSLPSR
jgi:hypothetical protein